MVICDVSDYIPFISKYFEFLYTILHAHCVPKINRWKVPFSDRYHAINVIASGKLLTRHQKVFAHILSLWCKIGSFRWKKVCLRPYLVQTITVFITKSIKILTIHENYSGEWKYKKRNGKWCGGYIHFVLF